jgi:adenylate cyclase
MRAYLAKGGYLVISQRWNEALSAADTGLAINPNFAPLYATRGVAENSLGDFEPAKSDLQLAMRLSPRDPRIGLWHVELGDVELNLTHFDAAIAEYKKAIDVGFRTFIPYANLAAGYALEGKMDEAKTFLTEARRLNSKLTVKWLIAHAPNLPILFAGLRKAGLPEE